MDTLLIEGRKVRREGGRMIRPEARLGSLPTFRTIRGWAGDWDDSGTLLVGEVPVQLEWPVYLAISVEKYWTNTWQVVLHAVAPKAPDVSVLDAALTLQDVSPEELAERDRATAMVEALVNYGACATLSEFYSESARSAVLAAQAEAIGAAVNLSLYLDCPVNTLGHTGWDFIRGLTLPPKKDANVVPNVGTAA